MTPEQYLLKHADEWTTTCVRTQRQADEHAKLPIDSGKRRAWIVTPREAIEIGFGENMEPDEDSAVGWTACDVGGIRHQHPLGENCARPIDWLIVQGGTNPLHPDWVRSLRDQADDAGVPFWFDGWGEWLPGDNNGHFVEWQDGVNSVSSLRNEADKCIVFKDNKGRWSPKCASRVGKDAAGHLLDGREWRQTPEGVDI